MSGSALAIEDLKVYYWTERGPIKAVDGVSLSVKKGERFGIVGESGCGKSTLAMSLLRLIKPPGTIEGGRIGLDGTEVLDLNDEELRAVRWSRISLVPQGSMNSLNPVVRVGSQIADAIIAHTASRERGDMKQRVCIAMAIVLKPQVIIADEPTGSLDVVIQRVVTQTLVKVQERLAASLMIIGHDMGYLAQLVDRLAVMYAGKVAEVGAVENIYNDPLHPYTQLLIASVPSVKEKKKLLGIPGLPPNLLFPPPGCSFHPRCPEAMEECREQVPELREVKPGRFVACHLYHADVGTAGEGGERGTDQKVRWTTLLTK